MRFTTGRLKYALPAVAVLLAPHMAYCNGLALTAAERLTVLPSTFATTNPGNTQCCNWPLRRGRSEQRQHHRIDRKRTFVRLR